MYKGPSEPYLPLLVCFENSEGDRQRTRDTTAAAGLFDKDMRTPGAGTVAKSNVPHEQEC